MKKTPVFIAAILLVGIAASAQKLDASKVPDAVKTSFEKKYPGQTAKWENENGQFEAGFKQNGKTMSALFTADGTMTETETDIKISDLPAPVIAYIKAHYKGTAIKEGAKIIKADGTVNYEAEVNKVDVIFTEKGDFIKEVKD